MDAIIDERNLATVRMDSYLSYELPEPAVISKAHFESGGSVATQFSTLHELDKSLLKRSLNANVAKEIKIDV